MQIDTQIDRQIYLLPHNNNHVFTDYGGDEYDADDDDDDEHDDEHDDDNDDDDNEHDDDDNDDIYIGANFSIALTKEQGALFNGILNTFRKGQYALCNRYSVVLHVC